MTDGELDLDLDQLGLDHGGSVLLRLCLAELPVGARVRVAGHAPDLAVHLRAFARSEGHEFVLVEPPHRLAGPRAGLRAPTLRACTRWSRVSVT